MGSDWGVTTANPLEQIEVATRRIDPANRDKPALLPDQVLSVPDAVRAFTAGSAYFNHDSDGGTIAVGKRADLAILDRNIFDAEAGYPADAHVVRTVVRGRTVYESWPATPIWPRQAAISENASSPTSLDGFDDPTRSPRKGSADDCYLTIDIGSLSGHRTHTAPPPPNAPPDRRPEQGLPS